MESSSKGIWYKLVFKQVQPIHIGYKRYGVINETRIFIPGWTMWGALTNIYGLYTGSYEDIDEVFEEISCFWPSFDKGGNDVLFPSLRYGKLHLGNFSEEKFRTMFVDTIISTAISPVLRSAKDESLHEIDVILPRPREEFVRELDANISLYWVGILNIKDQKLLSFLKSGLEIFVGGDIKYGLGLLKLEYINECEEISKFKKNNFLEINEEEFNSENLDKMGELIVDIENTIDGALLKIKEEKLLFLWDTNNKEKIIDLENYKLEKGKLLKNFKD
ncbi:hypothetical protein THA_854 [Thermosipho africanus TCF52B]|uniref:Uncharacterized protein n=1 Tax=Thermosipho africanus (strain TCF52B) TaxID=484019 RepID=B7IGV0_THEAB|nr:hypothetical protein [Thermosipho africanus]ACJ75314.1 hypothetical protein THA_854 [Thermosipho africanus TCF52B]